MAFGQRKWLAASSRPRNSLPCWHRIKSSSCRHPKAAALHFQSSIVKPLPTLRLMAAPPMPYELKAKTPTNNYILVVHEFLG